MKYLKYFEDSFTDFLSNKEIQEEFRKDVPERLYDVWDICLNFSDDHPQDLKFFAIYGGGRFSVPIYLSDDFNIDIPNSFENLNDENKRGLLTVILTSSHNLRYPMEFSIKWDAPFFGCNREMGKLFEAINFSDLDVKLKDPKSIFSYEGKFIEIKGKNQSSN